MIRKQTTRRGILGTLLGLSTATVLYGALDASAWNSYENVEQSWIRDRHALLLQQFPSVCGAAQLDLELKLADLERRAVQFRWMMKQRPELLRGGVWQLSSLPWTEKDTANICRADATYRRHERYLRSLNEALREHPDYELLRQAQTRLWKTPEYHDVHRRYSDRMQALQNMFSAGVRPTAEGN